jgi:DNA-directed RNA polymerase subunit RPC12/RpoP
MQISEEKKFQCEECGGKTYRLPGSITSIYVCSQCGHSFDCKEITIENINNDENNDIDAKQNLIVKLFTDQFMRKYTDFGTFNDFVKQYSDYQNQKSFSINNIGFSKSLRKWDYYVKKNSKFKSWNTMFEKAVERYLKM